MAITNSHTIPLANALAAFEYSGAASGSVTITRTAPYVFMFLDVASTQAAFGHSFYSASMAGVWNNGPSNGSITNTGALGCPSVPAGVTQWAGWETQDASGARINCGTPNGGVRPVGQNDAIVVSQGGFTGNEALSG